ncbi:prolyl 4-hydroxylase subunit alpha-1-like [Myxocyprinus asiaticus]|uniref:prolyl 4-hydroxylase subunit alpha-1-like n=1 Tax=Myxocyprinus asiaticus TaxID=70543 RepID=UPI002221F602|nr:prolyl 4-hydroxylase subunit alpha-1-like [Myxocyprinus asiaticus]
MGMKEPLLFVVCFWIVCITGHEFFSSTDQIVQLVEKEKELLGAFSLYIDAEEENLRTLKRVLLILQLVSVFDSGDPEQSVSDPVAAYKLLRRLRTEWRTIVKYTQRGLYQEKFKELLDLAFLQIPRQNDLDEAASGLIRLQEIYKLYPHNISIGKSLSVDEAFDVGLVAYEEDKFQHAFLWFVYSLNKLSETEFSSVTKEELLHLLGSSAYHFGSLPVAIYFTQQLLNLDPTNEDARLELAFYRDLRLKRASNPDIFTLNQESSNSYEALCRGEVDERTSKKQRALSCRYSTGGGNPRLIYAPVKEEEEWAEPRIIRIHDILSDKETEILKNISRPYLTRSRVGQGTVSKIRVSQSVGLMEEDPVVARVSQRIADITGLSIKTAEPLQVQNYGIGGRYEPHYDASDDEDERIATFLIYMSDVEIGGATVFPKIGVKVKPEKGSAVFWYNLLQNGSLDLKTQHAGCPVLVGNKWVANKWIHEFGQEFRRPCSLSEWE